MFPTNGSEIVGVTAEGGGIAGAGAGGGVTCGVNESENCCADGGGEIVGGCHLPGPNFFALRDSSSALTPPYARQPITMQISAPNNAIPKSTPSPRSAV